MRRSALHLPLLLLAEVAAVAALHRLSAVPWLALPADGLTGWSAWLAGSAPEDVLATALRLVGLACGWWLLGSTALYVLARLSRLPRAVAAVEWATLPAVRRLADRSIAMVLTTSTVLGSGGAAWAQVAPVPAFPGPSETAVEPAVLAPPGAAFPLVVAAEAPRAVPAGEPAPLVAPPEEPGTAGEVVRVAVRAADLGPGASGPGALATSAFHRPAEPAPSGRAEAAPAAAPPSAAAAPSQPPADERTHRVAPGEHLWAVAAAELAAARGVEAPALPDREIHAYWVALIAANRGELISGDPNLVHAGEVLHLPPLPGTDR